MADLSKLVAQIQRAQGAGSIVRLGDREAVTVDTISTRIPSLDRALGIGGLPRGRVIEVIGQESGGKTTLTLQVIAEAQSQGGNAAFIDAEHAFDTTYAAKLGVDVDNLLVSQPDFGEQALEVAEALIRSGDVDVVVIDSVAALVPKNELEGEFGDAQMGLMARMMSQAMRKLTGAVAKSKCVLIFVNQIRSKIGVVFGSPETTTGGNALKFYASVRLDVRKIGVIKDGENPIGNKVRIKTLKNKLSSPYRETEVDLLFGYGFSRENDLVELAISTGQVEKSGAWLTWNQERFHGVSAFQEHLRSNPEHLKKLEEQLK